MKKGFSAGVLAASLLVSGAAAAQTDWTPVLCDVFEQCGNKSSWDGSKNALPSKYHASVVKTTGDVVLGKSGDDTMNGSYILKEATAFGYPLKKIDVQWGLEPGTGGWTLHFADDRFMALQPKVKRLIKLQDEMKSQNYDCPSVWELNRTKKTLEFGFGC